VRVLVTHSIALLLIYIREVYSNKNYTFTQCDVLLGKNPCKKAMKNSPYSNNSET